MNKISYKHPRSSPKRFGTASARAGGHQEHHHGTPRTLTRDPRKPWQKHGGNPDTHRTLHKLPCSIADGGID
jgi:hypothetical protein